MARWYNKPKRNRVVSKLGRRRFRSLVAHVARSLASPVRVEIVFTGEFRGFKSVSRIENQGRRDHPKTC